MYPEDFEIHDVVAPPSSSDLVVFVVKGGNSRLPALRWEELLDLRDAVVPNKPANKAKTILLLFPAICLSSKLKIDEVRQVMQEAWLKSGISVEHASEFVSRPIKDFLGSRQLYPEIKETIWSKHRKHGWVNDSPHSLRNPKVDGYELMIPLIRELFSALARGA